ncbi:MAG TPA: response regulator [Myxococcales bacterium]|nr:response regulator [Myxococcales bacterium]
MEFLDAAGRSMSKAGLEFAGIRERAVLAADVSRIKPDLIVVDGDTLAASGSAVASFLRASKVPLVFVLSTDSDRELIHALQRHAVEVLIKPWAEGHAGQLLELMEELARRPPPGSASWEEQIARNFVDLARRRKLRGTLVVNRGTPFEGRVVFRDGALVRAGYGPLSGMDAVREVLQLEDGLYELDASLDRPPDKIAHSATELEPGKPVTPALKDKDADDLKPRLLVVDDEPDIRNLVAKHLTRAGFDVATAEDGQAGVEAALKQPFDLMIADLAMPRMDGWEMLRTLKSDHRTQELPVIILSAHDDYRETLRAARAGAHDYLAKTGRSDVLVAAALKVVTPRLEALFHLLVNEPVEVRTQIIGLQWFLRAVARQKSTGTLALKDDFGTYRLEVREGQPVAAEAKIQRPVYGLPAFVRMLVTSNAQGAFTHGPVEGGGPHPITTPMEELIARTCDTLNGAESRANVQRLGTTTEYEIDPELYDLFCRVAPPKKVAFAQALFERKLPLAELGRALMMTQEQAAESFNELLKRGVIRRPARGFKSNPKLKKADGADRLERTPSPPAPRPKPRPPMASLSAIERKKALMDTVKKQLGEEPWLRIAEALQVSLVAKLDHDLTFQEMVSFAQARQFDWRDVHAVLAKLAAAGFVKRVFATGQIEPPEAGPANPPQDVEERELKAWNEWARKTGVHWRSALGSR